MRSDARRPDAKRPDPIREKAKTLPIGFPPGFGLGDEEQDALIRLACLPTITPMHVRVLAWEMGSAVGCVEAISSHRAGSGLDRRVLAGTDPDSIRLATEEAGARVALPGDPDYWPALLHLHDPPMAVFAKGLRSAPADVRVAVVGSRRPSALGREVAVELARGLAAAGVVVVSGGAVGIDAEAHRGALMAGRTVAVLGSGIDMYYPRANAQLLERVERGGTVISEYPPGVPAEARRFPARNRLIAGLSRAVVIVEATENSGTRSTAEHATELGLDIFAVPGPVTSPLSRTPHALIRDGATLTRGAEDILHGLGIEPATSPPAEIPELPEHERLVFDSMKGAMLLEAVSTEARLSAPEALEALMRLELRGLVKGVGGRYQRTFEGAAADGSTAERRRTG